MYTVRWYNPLNDVWYLESHETKDEALAAVRYYQSNKLAAYLV